MAGRLEGKIALVTGAASIPGLGSSTAFRFAEEGATVYLTDIDTAGLEAVRKQISDAGGKAIALKHDVTNEDDWDSVFAEIRNRDGRLDVLVNNAGVAILGLLETVSSSDWHRQIDINLNSVFYGTQRAVAEMRRVGNGGSIINISSVVGQIGVVGCTSYAAAKGGVRIMSKAVAMETAAESIRVNTVHPGMIHTNIQAGAEEMNPEAHHAILATIPMGRVGEAADVANMNLFLASDESKYVTGAEFTVDGGLITK